MRLGDPRVREVGFSLRRLFFGLIIVAAFVAGGLTFAPIRAMADTITAGFLRAVDYSLDVTCVSGCTSATPVPIPLGPNGQVAVEQPTAARLNATIVFGSAQPVTQSGAWTIANTSFAVSGSLPAGTNVIGAVTQSGTWNVVCTSGCGGSAGTTFTLPTPNISAGVGQAVYSLNYCWRGFSSDWRPCPSTQNNSNGDWIPNNQPLGSNMNPFTQDYPANGFIGSAWDGSTTRVLEVLPELFIDSGKHYRFPAVAADNIGGNGVYAGVAVNGISAVSVAAGAGTTVLKASSGRLVRGTITTAGTSGDLTVFNNASACSGQVLGVIPGATIIASAVEGATYDFEMPATLGITACGATGSPAATFSIN